MLQETFQRKRCPDFEGAWSPRTYPKAKIYCKFSLRDFHKSQPFRDVTSLHSFYKERSFTGRKVIMSFKAETPYNDSQKTIYDHLSRYVRSLPKKDLAIFLRFVTGADLLPDKPISISFSEERLPPRARTCVPMLILSDNYEHYNTLG